MKNLIYKKINIVVIYLFSIFFLNSQNGSELKTISVDVLAPEISNLVESDGSGVYQLLLKEAARRSNITIIEHFYPQKRAITYFLNGTYPYIYAYTDLAIEKLGIENVIGSFPLGVFEQYIFSKKGTSYSTIEQLSGLSVGGIIGDDIQPWYKNFTDKGITIKLVKTNDQNIQRIQNNKIDAFICFLPDINQYADSLEYTKESPLFTSYDRLTAYNTTESRIVVERISKALIQMKKDGTTKDILGEFYLEYNEDEISYDF